MDTVRSMAPTSDSNAPPKPSFAKVAASAYPSNPPTQSSHPDHSMNHPSKSIPRSPQAKAAQSPPSHASHMDASASAGTCRHAPVHTPDGSKHPVVNGSTCPQSSIVDDTSVKATANDDGSTQLSSDGSAKPQSFDTKSVASGTTFAMDEKESLRPDDSASIRAAIEEEDMFSAPGSVVAGSRVGSDLAPRILRDHYQDMTYLNPLPPRGGPGVLYHPNGPSPNAPVAPSTLPSLAETSPANRPVPSNLPDVVQNRPPLPDEKLVEALQSQRDRVWVLKLEQDIIDFVGQSKEATLTLPQCNAFYRMLAHKLADYYRLDHVVAQTATGSAVVITRTSFCIIPPPLSGVPTPLSASNTPPLVMPARKIMRRPDDPRSSETTTAANSEGPSAAVSESGVELGMADSIQNGAKPKSLTREEREKQYAEVRERIFGKSESGTGQEDVGNSEDHQNSRSSSTSGKKKGPKKQRNLSNDDFEPRSQFPGYVASQYNSNGYGNDQYYFQNYPQVHQGQPYSMQQTPQPMPFSQPYQVMGQESQPYGWGGPGMPPPQSNGQPLSHYQHGQTPSYDVSNHFQTAMQFHQPMPQNSMAGKMASPPIPPYAQQHQSMPVHGPAPMNQWTGQPYDPNYQFNRPMYGSPGYQDRGVPNMNSMPAQPYNYTQYPAMSFPAQVAPAKGPPTMTTPYDRTFNPQTQSFVPTGPANRHPAMAPNVQTMYGQYPVPNHAQQTARPTNGGPNVQYGNTSRHVQSQGPSIVGPPQLRVPPAEPKGHSSTVPSSSPRHSASSHGPPEKTVPEITAKWGTPSHLPPKPPPPQTMEPSKFHEINRGLGLHNYPGMTFQNTATSRGAS